MAKEEHAMSWALRMAVGDGEGRCRKRPSFSFWLLGGACKFWQRLAPSGGVAVDDGQLDEAKGCSAVLMTAHMRLGWQAEEGDQRKGARRVRWYWYTRPEVNPEEGRIREATMPKKMPIRTCP